MVLLLLWKTILKSQRICRRSSIRTTEQAGWSISTDKVFCTPTSSCSAGLPQYLVSTETIFRPHSPEPRPAAAAPKAPPSQPVAGLASSAMQVAGYEPPLAEVAEQVAAVKKAEDE